MPQRDGRHRRRERLSTRTRPSRHADFESLPAAENEDNDDEDEAGSSSCGAMIVICVSLLWLGLWLGTRSSVHILDPLRAVIGTESTDAVQQALQFMAQWMLVPSDHGQQPQAAAKSVGYHMAPPHPPWLVSSAQQPKERLPVTTSFCTDFFSGGAHLITPSLIIIGGRTLR